MGKGDKQKDDDYKKGEGLSDRVSLPREKLLSRILEIELHATRHRRASSLKTYLLHDLEMIADEARKLWREIEGAG